MLKLVGPGDSNQTVQCKSVSNPAHMGPNEGQKGQYTQEQPAQMIMLGLSREKLESECICVSAGHAVLF